MGRASPGPRCERNNEAHRPHAAASSAIGLLRQPESRVGGKGASSNEQKKDRPEQHRIVRPRLVNVPQKPLFKRTGSFVVAMATSMSMMSGMAARRVASPPRSKTPHDLDNADEGRRRVGAGMPIFTNRPTPSASG